MKNPVTENLVDFTIAHEDVEKLAANCFTYGDMMRVLTPLITFVIGELKSGNISDAWFRTKTLLGFYEATLDENSVGDVACAFILVEYMGMNPVSVRALHKHENLLDELFTQFIELCATKVMQQDPSTYPAQ